MYCCAGLEVWGPPGAKARDTVVLHHDFLNSFREQFSLLLRGQNRELSRIGVPRSMSEIAL
jgi:hypothetical protein